MKKLVKAAFLYIPIFIVVLYIVCSFIMRTRVFLNSPDGSKMITVYSGLLAGDFYIIPYKYTDFLPPKDNYCTQKIIFGRDRIHIIFINWQPSDEYYLKMTADCNKNRLHKNIKISTMDIDIIDSSDFVGDPNFDPFYNKKYNPPKYVNYELVHMLDNGLSILFGLVVVILVLIVEPILCFALLLLLIVKKIKTHRDKNI
jgi:hypothetical protein